MLKYACPFSFCILSNCPILDYSLFSTVILCGYIEVNGRWDTKKIRKAIMIENFFFLKREKLSLLDGKY